MQYPVWSIQLTDSSVALTCVEGAACCLRLILVHPSQRHGLATSKTVYCVCLPKYYNNISLKLDMFSNKKGYAYWSDTMKTGD